MLALRGRCVWLITLVQTEESGVDDLVLVDEGCASQGFSFEPVVCSMTDRRELGFFGRDDFIQKPARLGWNSVCAGALLFRAEQALQCITMNQLLVQL